MRKNRAATNSKDFFTLPIVTGSSIPLVDTTLKRTIVRVISFYHDIQTSYLWWEQTRLKVNFFMRWMERNSRFQWHFITLLPMDETEIL